MPLHASGVLISESRATAGIWVALAAPALILAASLGVEVSHWAVVRQRLQRTADLAAIAGAAAFGTSPDPSIATSRAADIAELNGISGGARSWDAAAKKLTEPWLTAQAIPGLTSPDRTAVQVTVRQPVELVLSRLFRPESAITLAAAAIAETSGASANPQPCILALDGYGSGVQTQPDLMIQGNPTITLTGCSLRSNASIVIGGSPVVTASGIYASGAISVNGAATVNGPEIANAAQIPDPYAAHPGVQQALQKLQAGMGAMLNDKPGLSTTLSPGAYAGWSISGHVTLSPGLYVVNGDISIGSQATLNGDGVTIVSSGSISVNGRASVTLSAPGTAAAGQSVPGILYATTSNGSGTINGNADSRLSGVIYAPNADITVAGTADNDTTGCLELIAGTVALRGNASFGSKCSELGAAAFGSLPFVPVVLVQ